MKSSLSCMISVLGVLADGALATGEETFENSIAPFLQEHCVRCHGPKKQKAKLMLHKLTDGINPSSATVWEAVLSQLRDGEMPPEEQTQPTEAERARVVGWIERALATARQTSIEEELIYPEQGNRVPHELLFPPSASEALPASPARIWRVRPPIYERFVERVSREPFKHRFRRESLFSTPWGLEGEGFRDYAALYWIGESETDLLISNAMRVAGVMCGGRYMRETHVFAKFLRYEKESTEEDLALLVDTAFEKILRREPTAEEGERYQAFLKANLTKLGRRVGLETTLAAVLLSPEAVFRFELGGGAPDAHGRVLLAPDELAPAISFALTDDAPDELLQAAARDGTLGSADVVRAHVRRILTADDIARPPLLRFFQEYFGYTEAPRVFKDQATKRKARLSGNYSPESLVSDTDKLVLHVLAQDQEVLRTLLTTNLSFVASGFGRFNSWEGMKEKARRAGKPVPPHPFVDRRNRINEHYNITFEEWTEEMPFPLNKEQRAGILTQPSWLIAHSTNFENHAILRGKWILERLLGGSLPDTPITVDAQLPDDETLTLRERMRVTREAFCWECHQKMDPLGLPFEQFDHFGRFRTRELGGPVDARGAVVASGDSNLDGPVGDPVELMHRLADSRRVQQVFVRHAFRFFMGRNESPRDAKTLMAVDRAYSENGGSMRALVEELLVSDSFLYRLPAKLNDPAQSAPNPTSP